MLTIDDIARVTSTPASTVRGWLHRLDIREQGREPRPAGKRGQRRKLYADDVLQQLRAAGLAR